MAERILEGYREKFRTLLARVRPRRLDFGVELLVGRAQERARRESLPLPRALAELYESTRVRVEKRLALMPCTLPEQKDPNPRFACDAHLGGLARWLRAAGYEAAYTAGIADARLVEQARALAAVLLTGDVGIMRRRPVKSGEVRALWIPSSLSRAEQFQMVVRELELRRREPRCMACGGTLLAVDKQAVAARIPPRTARWKDEFFACSACDQLFWRGTHWAKIAECLERAVPV
jgi:uncharacterized protein with PIN domain